jgi:hypothetical protein
LSVDSIAHMGAVNSDYAGRPVVKYSQWCFHISSGFSF